MTPAVVGLSSVCHCGRPCAQWLELDGRYVCVHGQRRCRDALPEVLEEIRESEQAAGQPDVPRGAYARRRSHGAVGTVTRLHTAPLGAGSPFHRPGMPAGAPWVVLSDTNQGHVQIPCGGDETKARALNSHNRVMTGRGWEIAYGAVFAAGGAVVTPAGELVDCWGSPVVIGRPRWRPLTRVSYWMRCAGCHRQLWPGCLVTLADTLCSTCARQGERDDPRVWPPEPAYPGDDARPDHLKKAEKRR